MKTICFYEPLEFLGFLKDAKACHRCLGPVCIAPLKNSSILVTAYVDDFFIFLIHKNKKIIGEMKKDLIASCISIINGFCSDESSKLVDGYIYDKSK